MGGWRSEESEEGEEDKECKGGEHPNLLSPLHSNPRIEIDVKVM